MNQISKSLLIKIIWLLSVLALGCATESVPVTKTTHIAVRQGIKVSVSKYATFRGLGCLSGPSVDVSVTVPPQHGRLFVESEEVGIESILSGNPSCIGKTVKGKSVYYISNHNYIGEDNFSYMLSAPQIQPTNLNIVVDVYP